MGGLQQMEMLMPGTPPPDEEIDRLLASLDPLDRGVLFVEGVESARDALGDAIVREARGSARTRVAVGGRALGVERRPRPLRRARSRRLALLEIGRASCRERV